MCAELCLFAAILCLIFGGSMAAAIVVRARREAGRLLAAARADHGYWVALGPTGPALPAYSGSGRRIVYSNSQQRLWLVEANGVVSHSYLVSGRHGLPSVGEHHVFSKVTSSPSGHRF